MNMVRNKALRCSWAVLCCAVLAGSGSCAELTRVELPAHSTIDELLRLDSQAALEAARKNIFGVPNGVGLGEGLRGDAPSSNEVLAIYGLGKALTAEVLLDSEPHVFKTSRARPVWGHSLQYTLERIEPPCVHLKKSTEDYILCLRKNR